MILCDAVSLQALIIPEKFQHILRVLNTNIDGRHKIMFGLTAIKVRREEQLYVYRVEYEHYLIRQQYCVPSTSSFGVCFENESGAPLQCSLCVAVGRRAKVCQPGVQEGRCRHELESRRTV